MDFPTETMSNSKRYEVLDVEGPFTHDNDPSLLDSEAMSVGLQQRRQSTKQDFLPKLLPEIVSLIFLYACQPTPDPFLTLESNPQWKRQFYPLWLGHVCKSWRDFAWNASELWTTIVIRIAVSPEDIDVQGDLLQEWLDRASGRPLDIYVEETSYNSRFFHDEGRDYDVNSLLLLLVQRSDQWRTIDFHLPHKRYKFISLLGTEETPVMPHRRVPNRNVTSLPSYSNDQAQNRNSLSLNRLQNASLHDGENIMRSDLPINLAHAPSLQELKFSSMMMKPDLLLYYPTKRITRLTLSLTLRIVPRQLFAQFPLLQELTLSRCSVVRKLEPDANSRPITHGNLRTLHIESESEFVFNMLVHQLSFPALESLYLCVPETFRHTNFLLSFIRRSECALTRLTVESSITADYDLIGFLSSDNISASLRELHILDHDTIRPERKKALKRNKEQGAALGLGESFFENFHPHAYPNFLPHLEILEYRGLLSVQEIDFLEGFILRSRVRDSTVRSDTVEVSVDDMAILRKASIQADHVSGVPMSIAEYPGAEYVWEVIRMVEEGVFVLLDAAGTPWM